MIKGNTRNSNLLTFILAAVGGFIGALIGTSFTRSGFSSDSGVSKVTVARAQASQDAADCPAAPPCPPCEEQQGADSAAGQVVEGSALPAGAPSPPGSYKVANFYPLRHVHNRFEKWYDNHRTGKGVWKWTQYFPAWERHFAKFIAKSWAGEEVHMAELGIFSGGSLEMWLAVFGPGLRLWGCDIATVTKQYETDDKSGRTKIFNMDQTSPAAWTQFKKLVPKLDILIDDGLHLFTGQKAAFDGILDHIAPGGVFMTEDISDGKRPGQGNGNYGEEYKEKYFDYSFAKTRDLHVERSAVQGSIDSIHYYPYLFVVEKRENVGERLKAVKHGTLWKPISRGVVAGQHAGRDAGSESEATPASDDGAGDQ
jgi:hypothetical protein